MARSKRRMKKIEPSVKTLTYVLGAGGTCYIDLSLSASILNRRFYRQGLNWAVAGMTLWSGASTQTISVFKLPDTWVSYNAWVKSFKLWQEMNDQVLDVEPGIEGRYSDFKIYMDKEHRENIAENSFQTDVAVSANKTLIPVCRNTGSGNYVTADLTNLEWDHSEYVFPDPVDGTADSYHAHMVGENSSAAVGTVAGSKGLIIGYAYSRARPNVIDPNVPESSTRAWMNDVFDYGDQNPDIRADLIAENDSPPYALAGDASAEEYYPGGFNNLNGLEVVVPELTVTGTTDYSGRIQMGGFNVPCGLLCVKNSGACFIQVHLTPGQHRGYLAVPMQEF